jgi:hypothetical protein
MRAPGAPPTHGSRCSPAGSRPDCLTLTLPQSTCRITMDTQNRSGEKGAAAMEDSRKFDVTRFEAVDIRSIADDDLDDIVGGFAIRPNSKIAP